MLACAPSEGKPPLAQSPLTTRPFARFPASVPPQVARTSSKPAIRRFATHFCLQSIGLRPPVSLIIKGIQPMRSQGSKESTMNFASTYNLAAADSPPRRAPQAGRRGPHGPPREEGAPPQGRVNSAHNDIRQGRPNRAALPAFTADRAAPGFVRSRPGPAQAERLEAARRRRSAEPRRPRRRCPGVGEGAVDLDQRPGVRVLPGGAEAFDDELLLAGVDVIRAQARLGADQQVLAIGEVPRRRPGRAGF